jgi:hypothetical protein
MARWSVDLIRKRMERLGTVVASDEREATCGTRWIDMA